MSFELREYDQVPDRTLDLTNTRELASQVLSRVDIPDSSITDDQFGAIANSNLGDSTTIESTEYFEKSKLLTEHQRQNLSQTLGKYLNVLSPPLPLPLPYFYYSSLKFIWNVSVLIHLLQKVQHAREEIIEVDSYNLSTFILSIVTFENIFVTTIVYVSYLSEFLQEIFKSFNIVVIFILVIVLLLIKVSLYLLTGPEHLVTKFVLKVPELVLNCLVHSWMSTTVSFIFIVYWACMTVSSGVSLIFVRERIY